MKKSTLLVLVVLMVAPIVAIAQDNAIGLRFGGGSLSGAEVSYQTPMWGQRLEADLGWGGNSDWGFVNITALYQIVFPIEHGFNWYVGFGPSVGHWAYRGNDVNEPSAGLGLGLALNGGAEYNFPEIPLQLSVDTRPIVNLTNNGGDSWFGLALSARYKF